MSNHLHLLFTDPQGKIHRGIADLCIGLTRSIEPGAGHFLVESEFSKCERLVSNLKYYLYTLKYIYRNPVSASVCRRVEDYPFSSLRAFLKQALGPDTLSRSIFDSHPILLSGPRTKLRWLNAA